MAESLKSKVAWQQVRKARDTSPDNGKQRD
jgi:hypothetical protein